MSNPLLNALLHALPWWVALIPAGSLLLALLKTPRVKGWLGEVLLHRRLRRGLDGARYRLFHNLILPTSDGTTQIDHVVVSPYGIFVIETKNYDGWIFGSERDRMWTQKFRRSSYSFQNPLRQNYKHVRALAELTSVDDGVLFSMVVFVGKCTFKTPMPDNVTRAGACLAAIRARTDVLLSEAEIEAVIARIGEGRVAPSHAANAAHARHVQALVAKRKGGAAAAQAASTTVAPAPSVPGQASIAPAMAARVEPQLEAEQSSPAGATQVAPGPAMPSCPRCGGALDDYTFRSGARTGQTFRGCTRFPACSYRLEPAGESAATPA